MDTARWEQVKEIFEAAREKPASDREAYVAATSGGDVELRARVAALLAADVEASGFLASPTAPDSSAPARDDSALFERLQRAVSGRYSLQRELGRGGMGIVFLARDVALDRPVAIKLLPPELANQLDYRARFLREAKTAAGLSHPNIVPIHLVEEHGDLVFFVMAVVDGESLGDRLRRTGPLKPADAAKLLQEVAWALGYAHSRGVIHRDIKPDNILIDKGSGRALVTDFGIARVTTAGTVSQPREVLGTMRYMSPEQASADAVIDGRADLYSLGVTAFVALTGRFPFESDNQMALIAMHVTQPAPPLLSVNRAVPARLAEAVDRCLAKDPAARFPTGEALADAVGDAQVARRDVAPSVREFLAMAKSSVVIWYALAMLWFLLASLEPNVAPKGRVIGQPLGPVFYVITVAAILAVIVPINATRRVLRAGLDERDVAEALALSTSARDANVDYELTRVERLGDFMASVWTRSAFLALAAYIGLEVIAQEVYTDAFTSLKDIPVAVGATLGVASIAAAGLAPKRVMMRVFNALTRGTPEYAAFFGKIWSGPIGRVWFRVAGLGMKRGKALPILEAAPTEVVLGRAAGELFDQLPAGLRGRLGDVQDVIRGLEGAAAKLRSRRDGLTQAVAEAGALGSSERRASYVAELEAARVGVESRLGTAVASLENLRLDLLRLRAGVGSAEDLTLSIEEARSVGAAVDRELDARREVESVVAQVTPRIARKDLPT
jgi:hypothetical protein